MNGRMPKSRGGSNCAVGFQEAKIHTHGSPFFNRACAVDLIVLRRMCSCAARLQVYRRTCRSTRCVKKHERIIELSFLEPAQKASLHPAPSGNCILWLHDTCETHVTAISELGKIFARYSGNSYTYVTARIQQDIGNNSKGTVCAQICGSFAFWFLPHSTCAIIF